MNEPICWQDTQDLVEELRAYLQVRIEKPLVARRPIILTDHELTTLLDRIEGLEREVEFLRWVTDENDD